MIVYLDTSAVGKLLVDEPETAALSAHLDARAGVPGVVIASAALLETELRRLADRVGVAQVTVTEVLQRITLIDMERGVFREAGLILSGGPLRSLDALHIAVAQRIAADEFVSYDARQGVSAVALGLNVVHPGRV